MFVLNRELNWGWIFQRNCQQQVVPNTSHPTTATPLVEDEEDMKRGHGAPDRPEAVLESPALLARTFFLGALGGLLFPLPLFLVGLNPTHCRKRASLFSIIVKSPLGLILVSIPCAARSSASSEHAIGTSNGEAPVMLGETECFTEDSAPS